MLAHRPEAKFNPVMSFENVLVVDTAVNSNPSLSSVKIGILCGSQEFRFIVRRILQPAHLNIAGGNVRRQNSLLRLGMHDLPLKARAFPVLNNLDVVITGNVGSRGLSRVGKNDQGRRGLADNGHWFAFLPDIQPRSFIYLQTLLHGLPLQEVNNQYENPDEKSEHRKHGVWRFVNIFVLAKSPPPVLRIVFWGFGYFLLLCWFVRLARDNNWLSVIPFVLVFVFAFHLVKAVRW